MSDMTIDREYILAGLTGMLIRDEECIGRAESSPKVRRMIQHYEITPEEQKRCAGVAMRLIMQGRREMHGPKAQEMVAELMQIYGITYQEMLADAWSVFAGVASEPSKSVDAEVMYHVVKYFLYPTMTTFIQEACGGSFPGSFGYTGAVDSFMPKERIPGIIEDLVYGDLSRDYPDNISIGLICLIFRTLVA